MRILGKSCKTALSLLLTAVMVGSLFTLVPFAASAAENGAVLLTESTAALSSGSYTTAGDLTVANRLECIGDVHLSLPDGATLTVPKGITVTGSASLTIDGAGKLVINAVDENCAGIGGRLDESLSSLTVNGGELDVTGGAYGAGIGGGKNGFGGKVVINGGTVTAHGGTHGAGIGTGALYESNGATHNDDGVTVTGGAVNATGGENGAGIGEGHVVLATDGDMAAAITLTGGVVTAYANGITPDTVQPERGKQDIGGNSAVITITGGNVWAKGGGMTSENVITMSWTDATDSIYAYAINADVTLRKDFTSLEHADDRFEKDQTYSPVGNVHPLELRTLVPNAVFPYTVTWRNCDGAVLKTERVEANAVPSYGRTPEKGLLRFYGWQSGDDIYTGALPAVTADVTFTAVYAVDYLDENGDEQRKLSTEFTVISDSSARLSGGWYAVASEVSVAERIECTGDVRLILCDGAKLSDTKGISVNENVADLTIYGQRGGTGELYIKKEDGIGAKAAIGGDQDVNSGVITINGGTVTAYGQYEGAGIGGGNRSNGTVIINGGTVNAYGDPQYNFCAAIGGGYDGNGTVTVNGGVVNANGVIGGFHNGTGTVRLSWKNKETDRITAQSYIGSVTLVKGFIDQDRYIHYAGAVANNSNLADKTLTPYENAKLVGYSLSLDGDIGVNFYMELSQDVAESETAYMQFEIPGDTPTTQRVYVNDQHDPAKPCAQIKTVEGYDAVYHVFKCRVAAKEMTSPIRARLTGGVAQETEYTYSVKEYADYLLAHADSNETFANAAPLVRKMLNYGAYAQLFFDKNPDTLANVGLSDADKALEEPVIDAAEPVVSGLPNGTTFAGATLSLKSETTLSLYFKSSETLSFSCENYTVETVISGSYQVARIRGIKAKHIGDRFTVNLSGGGAVTYSPMNYCQKVLADASQDVKLQNAVRAFCAYFKAADAYFTN